MIPVPSEAPVFAEEEAAVEQRGEEVAAAPEYADEVDRIPAEPVEEAVEVEGWATARDEAAADFDQYTAESPDPLTVPGDTVVAPDPARFDDAGGDASDDFMLDAADLALSDRQPVTHFDEDLATRFDEDSTVREDRLDRLDLQPAGPAEPASEPAQEVIAPPVVAASIFDRSDSAPPQIVERGLRQPMPSADGPDRGLFEAAPPPEHAGPGVLPLAVVLIVGLLLGFGAGYFAAGRREAAPAAAAGAAAAPAPTAAAPPAAPAAGPGTAAAPTALPEAPRARGAAAAPPSRSGRLVVRSTPSGAAVTINGKWSGRTPLTRDALAFGDYAVRVLLPGYQTRREQISLSADAASRTLTIQLQREAAALPTPDAQPAPPAAAPAAAAATGSLDIDSRPVGAQVFVDDRAVGTTPVRVPDVTPGSHVVRLELAGHRTWSEAAQVARGKATRVAGSLEPIR